VFKAAITDQPGWLSALLEGLVIGFGQ
jgi:hypothetical protein